MMEQTRSKRPKRLSARRNPEAFLYALSWQEERDIQRAMYKSLKESRGEPPPPSPPKPKEEEEEEEEKQPVRKSPRLRVPVRLDNTLGLSVNGDSSENQRFDLKASSRPLLMRASSSSALEDGNLTPKGEGNGAGIAEHSRQPLGKKRILAPRRSMGEIPVELWVDPSGKPVVTRDFLDFLCFRGDQPLSGAFPGPSGAKTSPPAGSAALPPKLAWFELPPQQRPQAKLFTTGSRGPAARTKVAARDKRTSMSGGLISDSSSNSGLSRRNSGQSSPSGEDNTTNTDRNPRAKESGGTRKKSRSLFYQIMTAKLRRLQSHANTHKRLVRPSTSLSSPSAAPSKAAAFIEETESKDDGEESIVGEDGRVRRSTRVQALQNRLRRDRLSLERLTECEQSPPTARRSLPAMGGAKGAAAERQMVTRQRAKDILLRAKTLRQR